MVFTLDLCFYCFTFYRLYRPKEEVITPSKDKSPNKQVSFNKENIIENKVDKLEQILTGDKNALERKLELKTAEAEALEEVVKTAKESEEKMAGELEEKKQEAMRLADQLAAQAKEQMDSIKVTDLQAELEDTKTALKVSGQKGYMN